MLGKIKGQATTTCRLYKVGDKVKLMDYRGNMRRGVYKIDGYRCEDQSYLATHIAMPNEYYYVYDSEIIGYAKE